MRKNLVWLFCALAFVAVLLAIWTEHKIQFVLTGLVMALVAGAIENTVQDDPEVHR